MYESKELIAYLFRHYGDMEVPAYYRATPVKPLFSTLVREVLCELEIPYTLHNLGKEHRKEVGPALRRITPNPYVPRGGGKRHAFWAAHGRVQVPYLEDPNTGAALFESADIIDYLESTCAR